MLSFFGVLSTCRWVGSVPVKAISGGDVAAQAVQRLKEIRLKEIPVVIQVATKGLYVINKTTGDILKEVAIEDISFVSQDTNQVICRLDT